MIRLKQTRPSLTRWQLALLAVVLASVAGVTWSRYGDDLYFQKTSYRQQANFEGIREWDGAEVQFHTHFSYWSTPWQRVPRVEPAGPVEVRVKAPDGSRHRIRVEQHRITFDRFESGAWADPIPLGRNNIRDWLGSCGLDVESDGSWRAVSLMMLTLRDAKTDHYR